MLAKEKGGENNMIKKIKKQVKRNNINSISSYNNSIINTGSSSNKFKHRK